MTRVKAEKSWRPYSKKDRISQVSTGFFQQVAREALLQQAKAICIDQRALGTKVTLAHEKFVEQRGETEQLHEKIKAQTHGNPLAQEYVALDQC